MGKGIYAQYEGKHSKNQIETTLKKRTLNPHAILSFLFTKTP